MKNYDNEYWAERVKHYNKTSWVKNKDFLDSFLNLLPKQKYDSILEVGIGTGAVAEKVVEKLGTLNGIDISPDMISKIENPNINAAVGDAHYLNFKNNTFDLIYMRNVIHYLDHPKKAIAEIFRCLKPGGYFLFSQVVPPDDSISEEYDWLVGRDIHYPTQKEINQLFLIFSNIKQDIFILKNQSIMNWLNNTCNDESKKQGILHRHRRTSDSYKSLANYSKTEDDILVDIKHVMMIGSK